MAPSQRFTMALTVNTLTTSQPLSLFGHTFYRSSDYIYALNIIVTTNYNISFNVQSTLDSITSISMEYTDASTPYNVSLLNGCFNNLHNLTEFTVNGFIIFNPTSTSVFSSCYSLISVAMDRVTQINARWFEGCTALTNISLPSVTTIKEYAFLGCTALTNISLPSVTTIEEYAFKNCNSLTTLYIPSSINSLPFNIFNQISSTITINTDNDIIPIFTTFTANVTSPSVIIRKTIYSLKIKYTTNASYTLSSINTTFGTTLFFLTTDENTNDTAYYFSTNAISIPPGSSNNTSTGSTNTSSIPYKEEIKSIIISGLITNISYSAFTNCSALISIEAPLVTSISNYAFENCTALTSFTIPNTIATMGQYVFYGCSLLTTINFPASSTTYTVIGNSTFNNCLGLTSIIIPNYITKIGTTNDSYSFRSCSNLQTVTFASPSSLTSIGSYAFAGCSQLQTITLPNSITSIGDSIFFLCSQLQTITLPNSITSIADGMFNSCSQLQTITLPNSITSIGNNAFAYCIRLSKLTILQTITSINPTFITACRLIIIYTDNLSGPIKSVIDTINSSLITYSLTQAVSLLLIVTNEIPNKNRFNALKNGNVLK